MTPDPTAVVDSYLAVVADLDADRERARRASSTPTPASPSARTSSPRAAAGATPARARAAFGTAARLLSETPPRRPRAPRRGRAGRHARDVDRRAGRSTRARSPPAPRCAPSAAWSSPSATAGSATRTTTTATTPARRLDEGAVYSHFPGGKDELVLAVLDRHIDELVRGREAQARALRALTARLGVVPEHVVHPGLLGGWVVARSPQSQGGHRMKLHANAALSH